MKNIISIISMLLPKLKNLSFEQFLIILLTLGLLEIIYKLLNILTS